LNCAADHTTNEPRHILPATTDHEGIVPSQKQESDMTNLNVDIEELTMDQLSEVSAGDHAPGTRSGGGGGKGTGPGTGGGNGHGGIVWAGGDGAGAAASIA